MHFRRQKILTHVSPPSQKTIYNFTIVVGHTTKHMTHSRSWDTLMWHFNLRSSYFHVPLTTMRHLLTVILHRQLDLFTGFEGRQTTIRTCCTAECIAQVALQHNASALITDKQQWHSIAFHHSVKVKFSHTRYRALGRELIPVYRQSARRWREVNHAIYPAVVCHCFLPGLRWPP